MQPNFFLVCALAFVGAGLLVLPIDAAAENVFDPALKIQRVRLKADPLNPQAKREVSCTIYPRMMVKQVDLGEVGADRLSILPYVPGKTPACRQNQEQGEYVIPSELWSGYFSGVKAGHVFFDASDGNNGGLGFMVFRLADRKKIFDDTAQKGIRSIEIKDGAPTLHYQRVFAADCSILTGSVACRDAIVKATGIAGASLSLCTKGYQAAKAEMAKMRCEAQSVKNRACIDNELKHIAEQKWDEAPTVVVYDVAVSLGGAAPIIKPLGDAVACRPSD